jgi:hypothetical protein
MLGIQGLQFVYTGGSSAAHASSLRTLQGPAGWGGGGCCNGNRNPCYNFSGISQSAYYLGYALDNRGSISGGGLNLSRRHHIDSSLGLSLHFLPSMPGLISPAVKHAGCEPDHCV